MKRTDFCTDNFWNPSGQLVEEEEEDSIDKREFEAAFGTFSGNLTERSSLLKTYPGRSRSSTLPVRYLEGNSDQFRKRSRSVSLSLSSRDEGPRLPTGGRKRTITVSVTGMSSEQRSSQLERELRSTEGSFIWFHA